MSAEINSLEGRIKAYCQKNGLDWQSIKSYFSVDDFRECLLADPPQSRKKSQDAAKNILTDFEDYKEYTSETISRERKGEIICAKMKQVEAQISNINDGKLAHLAFIPRSAWEGNIHQDGGFIVDFLDISFIPSSDAKRMQDGEIDVQNIKLCDAEKDRYDTMFFIKNNPGYAMIESHIQSPWIEYLMQRFANSFIRIGVDGPRKGDIGQMLMTMFP